MVVRGGLLTMDMMSLSNPMTETSRGHSQPSLLKDTIRPIAIKSLWAMTAFVGFVRYFSVKE